jgi:signal peptidase I
MPESNRESFLKEVLSFGAIALLIVLPIRIFIAQPFVVSGSSMEPTFHDGEYLIVDQATYHFTNPQRGEVVIFRYPKDTSKYFIKRIIGLPGETVHIVGDQVSVTEQNGTNITIPEPYVVNHGNGSDLEMTLEAGDYFVMGDNRPASSDSRVWGVLPREDMVGRAYLRLFPLTRINVFPGSVESFK